MKNNSAPFIAISRHRIQTDGAGVTTLCAFHGCPLRCKYCINPQSFSDNQNRILLSPSELYERVRIDNIYFLATGGGITFGGGEPLLYPSFIAEFRGLCGKDWRICIETSLNVPKENVLAVADIADEFFVDIKDTDSAIYESYTGKSNHLVLENLKILLSVASPERITVRIPLIKDYNTPAHQQKSIALLKEMGITKFDIFEYKIKDEVSS